VPLWQKHGKNQRIMNKTLRHIFLGLVLFIMAAPLAVVSGVSLNAKKRLFFPPEGISLRWYVELLSEKAWLIPVQNSLTIAASSSLIAISIALPLAYFLWRYRVFYARALFALGVSPFILPPVITALGFLSFWATIGLYGQMMATMISHAIFFVTLPLVTISLGFESIDNEIVEAAETMGANSRMVFHTVIFPMVRPYMISGYAFAFVLSLNEYIVAYMVAGFTVETLPIKIFNALRYGYTPVMASVTVVFVLLAVLIFGLIGKFGDLPKLLGALNPEQK
jgi:putative spermidine/putrescine transport system permease protein